MSYNLTVFYDYLCPFSNRIMEWLEKVKQSGQMDLNVKWKVLSLEQINQKQGEGFKLWEHPDYPSRGLPALTAAKAAQRQGESLFHSFHRLVFEAYHKRGKDISRRSVLLEAGLEAGLDIEKFREDLDLKENLQAIGSDYEEAKQTYNLFGVPSIIIENGESIYVKIDSVPENEEESCNLLEYILKMGREMPYLLELKKP